MICLEKAKRTILSAASKRPGTTGGRSWGRIIQVIRETRSLPRAATMEERNGEAANLDRTA